MENFLQKPNLPLPPQTIAANKAALVCGRAQGRALHFATSEEMGVANPYAFT
jgi:hypothetical protein